MIKNLLLLFFLFVLPLFTSFAATPPASNRMSVITSMSLAYDLGSHTLHVEAVHPSDNWEIDYIRMMTVSLNGQEVSTANYYHQTTAEGFSEDVQLNAQVGDTVTVELFCTGGSSMSKDLTVTESAPVQPEQSAGAGADNSTADSTAN